MAPSSSVPPGPARPQEEPRPAALCIQPQGSALHTAGERPDSGKKRGSTSGWGTSEGNHLPPSRGQIQQCGVGNLPSMLLFFFFFRHAAPQIAIHLPPIFSCPICFLIFFFFFWGQRREIHLIFKACKVSRVACTSRPRSRREKTGQPQPPAAPQVKFKMGPSGTSRGQQSWWGPGEPGGPCLPPPRGSACSKVPAVRQRMGVQSHTPKSAALEESRSCRPCCSPSRAPPSVPRSGA